ncbi:barstar family protein [Tomitella biformata]|uniref:barstar family protein n=1 Tax=Tomitella biformata TaxID=630403 RepID=UPI000464889B|nr:barstar family protein [Tomitella biformata]
MTTLREFYSDAGPVAGLLPGSPHDAAAVGYTRPQGFTLRAVRGSRMPTVAGVFDEFAAALQFPYYFGANKDAFDECMRELDETLGSAVGYVLLVRDADLLLCDEPGELAWFAEAMAFYAEHWAARGVAFKVLLQAAEPAVVARSWRKAGLAPGMIGA